MEQIYRINGDTLINNQPPGNYVNILKGVFPNIFWGLIEGPTWKNLPGNA